MALKGNVSGTWKDYVAWINVNGTWKKAAVWQNVSGTWKQITTLLGATLPSAIGPDENYSATAQFLIGNAGTWSATGSGGSGTWMLGGTGADYQVRVTQTAGQTITGDSLSTWLSLSSNYNWNLTSAQFDKSATATLEIRLAASPNTVLATSTLNFYCYGIL